jgi:hypothetical protein
VPRDCAPAAQDFVIRVRRDDENDVACSITHTRNR